MSVLALKTSISGHERSISALKFSPDGQYLASASADMTVRIWNVEDWTLKIILRGHSRGISDICWSPDSQYLASVGDDALVMLWSPLQSTPIRTLKGHTNYVFCVDWSPAGLIATGSFDESVRLWDARTGNCLRAVSAHGDPVTGVSFGPDGTILASSSYDGLVRIWDTVTGQCLKTIVDDDNPPVSSVKFSINGKFLLAPTLDSTIRLWSLTTDKCVKSYNGHVNRRYCIAPAFISIPTEDERSGSDMHIAAGSEDGRVIVWNLNSRAVVMEKQCHEKPVMAVAVHPTCKVIATGSLEPDVSIKIHTF